MSKLERLQENKRQQEILETEQEELVSIFVKLAKAGDAETVDIYDKFVVLVCDDYRGNLQSLYIHKNLFELTDLTEYVFHHDNSFTSSTLMLKADSIAKNACKLQKEIDKAAKVVSRLQDLMDRDHG